MKQKTKLAVISEVREFLSHLLNEMDKALGGTEVNYDAWLERPYTEAATEEASHEQFQETYGYYEIFEDWCENEPLADFVDEHELDEAFQTTAIYDGAFDAWKYGDR